LPTTNTLPTSSLTSLIFPQFFRHFFLLPSSGWNQTA
jgi:hypothetical protein